MVEDEVVEENDDYEETPSDFVEEDEDEEEVVESGPEDAVAEDAEPE